MCRKALFEKNFLTYASWISMQIKVSSFLHILNIYLYSHTKLNTLVLIWSLQLSNFGLTHVTKHFSVTIDCVIFLIRGFCSIFTLGIYLKSSTRPFYAMQYNAKSLESQFLHLEKTFSNPALWYLYW